MTDPNEHLKQEAAPSRFQLIMEFVRARFLSIVGVAAAAAGVALYLGVDIEIPRQVQVFLLAAVGLSPGAYMVGQYIVSLLWNPNYVYVLDIDAREIDGALYRFPYGTFKELEVVDGVLDQVTNSLYIGKNVDLENLTVEGTWRGTMSDRELLRSLQKIEECRGTLEEDAKRGFIIESQAWTIIRGATRSAVLSVVSTFERGTLPDEGEGINEEIDAALERFDLERQLRDENPDPSPEDVAESPEDLDVDLDDLEDVQGDTDYPHLNEVLADD